MAGKNWVMVIYSLLGPDKSELVKTTWTEKYGVNLLTAHSHMIRKISTRNKTHICIDIILAH